jgi:hypothetical protein
MLVRQRDGEPEMPCTGWNGEMVRANANTQFSNDKHRAERFQ